MAERITGWDTVGVTNVGVMDGDRVTLEFTGKDGEKRNIFSPAAWMGPFVANLMAVMAAARKQGLLQSDIGSSLTGVTQSRIASDEDGTEFVVSLMSGDGLEFRFHLSADIAKSLAEGLRKTLSHHGHYPDAPPPGPTRH